MSDLYCLTLNFYVQLHDLLKSLYDGIPLDRVQKEELKNRLDQWDEIECPDAGCVRDKCPYAMEHDWVTDLGWQNLHELIENLDQSKEIDSLPRRYGIDALNATWALRNGHYNP